MGTLRASGPEAGTRFAPGCLEPLLPRSEIGIWSGCLWLSSGPLHPALQGRERAGMPGLVPRPQLLRASHTALQDPDQSPGQARRLELLEAGTHSCVLAVRLFGRGQERNLGGAACVWRMTLPEPRSTDALLEAEAWPDWMARCWGCGPHRGPGGVSGDTEPATEPCSQFCLRLPVLPVCAHVWGPITQPDP